MNTIAIVGRPNVGKSTLFNRLVGRRQAIMDNQSGVTRDRHYGYGDWTGHNFTVIDTGGYVHNSDDIFESEINRQVKLAIDEADVVVEVRDEGPGLPAHLEPGEVLGRGVRDESAGGSGLGLYISGELLAREGGTLRLDTATEPRGCVAVVRAGALSVLGALDRAGARALALRRAALARAAAAAARTAAAALARALGGTVGALGALAGRALLGLRGGGPLEAALRALGDVEVAVEVRR